MSRPTTAVPGVHPDRRVLAAAAATPTLGLLGLLVVPGAAGLVLCLAFVTAGLVLSVPKLRLDEAGGAVTVMTVGYCLVALMIAGMQAVA